MGISKSPTGIVLALLLWGGAEFAIAKPIGLWTPHGEIQIEKYHRNPQSQQLNLSQAKKIQSNQSGYAYAIFTSVPSADERESIERSGGLKFLSVYDVRGNIKKEGIVVGHGERDAFGTMVDVDASVRKHASGKEHASGKKPGDEAGA